MRQPGALDHRQFVVKLLQHRVRRVHPAGLQSFPAQRFQIDMGAHPLRRGEDRQGLQAKIELKRAPFGDPEAVSEGFGRVGEQCRQFIA